MRVEETIEEERKGRWSAKLAEWKPNVGKE
jgi:hypothetical protein